jgi:SAM-dependent methyltransferase
MSDQMGFDEDTSRRIEAAYVSPELLQQRRATLELLRLQPGERVLDVGSGPGFLAAEMAAVVGAGGHVVAVDPSESMRALAAARERPAGAASIEHVAGDASALPVPDAHVDVVTSTQVYEYVEDIAGALAEARRVLRPGGRVLVLDTDWDSLVWHSTDPARMRRVLAAWDAHLVDPYLPRRLPTLLRDAGFDALEVQALPLLTVGTDERSFAYGIIGLVEAFVGSRDDLTPDEIDAWAADLRGLGAAGFFSLNRYLFLARRRD